MQTWFFLYSIWVSLTFGMPDCYERLTAPRGVIQTPNFPNKFNPAQKCKWEIDASELIPDDDEWNYTNSSIIVYMNEMFLREGVTFVDHEYCEYKNNPRTVFEVNLTSLTTFVQSFERCLVITLDVGHFLENTNVRVLDTHLDVFGFNLTYEITKNQPRNNSCDVSSCGYNGKCIDYVTHFKCECFTGFSGAFCSQGEKSMCYTDEVNFCRNGGTCRHIGDYYVSCVCPEGFAGSKCEHNVSLIEKQDLNLKISEQKFPCFYDEALQNTCKCINKTTESHKTSSKHKIQIKDLLINIDQVTEGNEFILTCKTFATKNAQFFWYKDNFHQITPNLKTSKKWTSLYFSSNKTIRGAMLTIQNSTKIDEGTFICQIKFDNLQFCKSIDVKIKSFEPPQVKLHPMSLTIRKGKHQNLRIICTGDVENTYSWLKNKKMLPAHSLSEKYEILVTGGSYLQIYSIEKTTDYTCLVQNKNGAPKSEKTITVRVLDRPEVKTCQPEVYDDVKWAETAPYTHAHKECPGNLFNTDIGYVSRFCSFSDGINPKWRLPDYSMCLPVELVECDVMTKKLELGYKVIDPKYILRTFLDYVTTNSLKSGSGSKIISLTQNVVNYLRNIKSGKIQDITLITFEIIDEILNQPNALLEPQHIFQLQNIIKDTTILLANSISSSMEFDDFANFKVSILHVDPYSTDQSDINGNGTQFRILIDQLSSVSNTSIVMASVVYYNLTQLFPDKLTHRIEDSLEIEYKFASLIVTVWPVPPFSPTLILQFGHAHIDSNLKINCGFTDFASVDYTWNTEHCRTKIVNSNVTNCECDAPNGGTFALILSEGGNRENLEKTIDVGIEIDSSVLITNIIVLVLLFLTLVPLLVTLVVHKSILTFLKVQSTFFAFLTVSCFTAAMLFNPTSSLLVFFHYFVQISFLFSCSSHLALVLILCAELTRPNLHKKTIVGIGFGVPSLAISGSHLARKTMSLSIESWFLVVPSVSFYVFVVTLGVILVLYVYLFVFLEVKFSRMRCKKMELRCKSRVRLLRRSGFVFFSLVNVVVFSILYVNVRNLQWISYGFSSSLLFMAMVMMICYILKSDIGFLSTKISKEEQNLKNGPTKNLLSVVGQEGPLNFFPQNQDLTTNLELPLHEKKVQLINSTNHKTAHKLPHKGGKCPQKSQKNSKIDENKIRRETSSCEDLDLIASSLGHRTNPDGDTGGPKVPPDKLLSSISQDLDYLLNRETPNYDLNNDNLKNSIRFSMTSLCSSHFPQIVEETDEDL